MPIEQTGSNVEHGEMQPADLFNRYYLFSL